ncbi:NADPH:quinone reductase-like Zn-dependent oxidoreductase [Nakamurella sp. UYEF19]|uniref:NADP-dependent oxidoreductase n=1 Tax=Nakamurella sp. UYEF19 TaxID=1756392 RepID=UPI0033997EEC
MPKAIQYSEYGDADVLKLTDIPLVEPGAGQVRVKVHAIGVNPLDWKIRRGYMSGGKPLDGPSLVGLEMAGVVDALGDGVTDFAVGDRVVGGVGGASAEFVLAQTDQIVALPDSIDFITGAAIKVAGTTAIRVLTMAGVRESQTLLLHAATGGVGLFVTQLARARDARVIGTAGAANQHFLASLGAIPVLYGDGWEDRVRAVATAPIDSVIDCSGAGVIPGSLELVVPGGPIVTIADFSATGPNVIATDGSEPGFEDSLREAVKAVEHGTVKIEIEKTFPLEQAADAYRLSEGGHVRGKIVLTIA